jgi:choline dehydrogenase
MTKVGTYDYIVVGGGSAGCAIARALSDRPELRVLLLEAGPPADRFWVHTPAGMAKLYFNRQLNWNYYTEPMPMLHQRRMYWPRGKALGGSSAINGMIYIRGHRNDFDGWRDLGNPGWGYDDVLPYFKSIEHNERGRDDYRAQGGPLWISDPAERVPSCADFIASAERIGIPRTDDLNGAVHDGVGYMQHTIRDGRRQSAYIAFIQPVRDRPNLDVWTDCRVERILFSGREATGVEVLIRGERLELQATREVIISCGSLNSPKLLMLSGIGPGEELGRLGIEVRVDSPGVGANLQDHFYIHCGYRGTPDSSYNQHISGLRKYWQGLRYLLTRRGYLALGSSQVAAFVKSSPEKPYADLQISFRPMSFTYLPSGVVQVDKFPGMGVSVYLLRPHRAGRVTLRSADPAQPPVMAPDFLEDPEDVRVMIAGIRTIRSIMAAAPIASRVVAEEVPGPAVQSDDQILEFMRATGNSAHHQGGTCKMGRDALAVVDERLRVRGTERLRVADASIMPFLTAGNTNAPTIMIGAKAADIILQDAAAPKPRPW